MAGIGNRIVGIYGFYLNTLWQYGRLARKGQGGGTAQDIEAQLLSLLGEEDGGILPLGDPEPTEPTNAFALGLWERLNAELPNPLPTEAIGDRDALRALLSAVPDDYEWTDPAKAEVNAAVTGFVNAMKAYNDQLNKVDPADSITRDRKSVV
jgi:hypothetical protein